MVRGGPEPLDLGWYVTYGVQTPTDPNVFSQYCTMKADTSVTSDLTEDVEDWCWTSPDQTTRCPTCDVMSFLDWYTFDGGEGGLFEISPAPSLAAVAEPTSAAILEGAIALMGLIWVRRRWLYRLRLERARSWCLEFLYLVCLARPLVHVKSRISSIIERILEFSRRCRFNYQSFAPLL